MPVVDLGETSLGGLQYIGLRTHLSCIPSPQRTFWKISDQGRARRAPQEPDQCRVERGPDFRRYSTLFKWARKCRSRRIRAEVSASLVSPRARAV
eukprot:scaffold1696_cov258-Pinguiococcus_pyrenoidosus.AAC.3